MFLVKSGHTIDPENEDYDSDMIIHKVESKTIN